MYSRTGRTCIFECNYGSLLFSSDYTGPLTLNFSLAFCTRHRWRVAMKCSWRHTHSQFPPRLLVVCAVNLRTGTGRLYLDMPTSFASRTPPVTELRGLAALRAEHDAHRQDVSFDLRLDEDRSHFDSYVPLKATPAVIAVNIAPALGACHTSQRPKYLSACVSLVFVMSNPAAYILSSHIHRLLCDQFPVGFSTDVFALTILDDTTPKGVTGR